MTAKLAAEVLCTADCRQLAGVGPKLEQLLAKLNISSVFDLLLHLPHSYEDRTQLHLIAEAKPGSTIQIQGRIQHLNVKPGKKTMLKVVLADETGNITLRFFHFNRRQWQVWQRQGTLVRVFGQARLNASQLELIHPDYQAVQSESAELDQHLTPVYPSTNGLSQNKLRKLIAQALDWLNKYPLKELAYRLPQSISIASINQALKYLHQPSAEDFNNGLLQQAVKRLAFEELLAQQLSLKQAREKTRRGHAYELAAGSSALTKFIQKLPFQLTQSQKRALDAIQSDLSQPQPMWRLLQGDVGCGKTVIAAAAAIMAVKAGYQVAIMAPTEVLAEQLYQNFQAWFLPEKIVTAVLTGRLKAQQKEQLLARLYHHEISVLLGTHALFQQNVEFSRLALVIVDEQHRFGVKQRFELAQKGAKQGIQPHQLLMTATPIPRTLAMTAYADLDHSIVAELPPGRQPINTVLISQSRRAEVINKVAEQCRKGGQVYWVCPLVESSEVLDCEAAEASYENLSRQLPTIKIGLVHGRMDWQRKAEAMQAFKQAAIQLLVATSVIEVGINVPQANIIVIENAERLGLSQLHQLRGRVGRGREKSYCLLLYKAPLTALARKRLAVMRDSQDGFKIAEMDLTLRGPGDLLGTQQSGLIDFRVADLSRDTIYLSEINRQLAILGDSKNDYVTLKNRWLLKKSVYKYV